MRREFDSRHSLKFMLKQSNFVKIRTAVPVESAEKVRKAMVDAGAGVQGNYSHCGGSY